jgi:hypothetical protein
MRERTLIVPLKGREKERSRFSVAYKSVTSVVRLCV